MQVFRAVFCPVGTFGGGGGDENPDDGSGTVI